MEANAGKSFHMQIIFNVFPRISLHCKLVPVQYWEYEVKKKRGAVTYNMNRENEVSKMFIIVSLGNWTELEKVHH